MTQVYCKQKEINKREEKSIKYMRLRHGYLRIDECNCKNKNWFNKDYWRDYNIKYIEWRNKK